MKSTYFRFAIFTLPMIHLVYPQGFDNYSVKFLLGLTVVPSLLVEVSHGKMKNDRKKRHLCRPRLFPSCKRSLPFLTVDAFISLPADVLWDLFLFVTHSFLMRTNKNKPHMTSAGRLCHHWYPPSFGEQGWRSVESTGLPPRVQIPALTPSSRPPTSSPPPPPTSITWNLSTSSM